jgi:hypothetical protein
MLRLFRIRGWCLATAFCLLAGSAGAPVEALLHSDEGHRDACVAAIEAPHDASAHRIRSGTAVPSESAPAHCAVCHWARVCRTGPGTQALVVGLDPAGRLAPFRDVRFGPAPALVHLASRAPPFSA